MKQQIPALAHSAKETNLFDFRQSMNKLREPSFLHRKHVPASIGVSNI